MPWNPHDVDVVDVVLLEFISTTSNIVDRLCRCSWCTGFQCIHDLQRISEYSNLPTDFDFVQVFACFGYRACFCCEYRRRIWDSVLTVDLQWWNLKGNSRSSIRFFRSVAVYLCCRRVFFDLHICHSFSFVCVYARLLYCFDKRTVRFQRTRPPRRMFCAAVLFNNLRMTDDLVQVAGLHSKRFLPSKTYKDCYEFIFLMNESLNQQNWLSHFSSQVWPWLDLDLWVHPTWQLDNVLMGLYGCTPLPVSRIIVPKSFNHVLQTNEGILPYFYIWVRGDPGVVYVSRIT